MVELKQLYFKQTYDTIAKRSSNIGRTARLGLTKVDGKEVLCFDNSDGEHATMYIDIEDLKRIIKTEEVKIYGSEPKMVGRMKIAHGIKDLITTKVGHLVYELDDMYFIEQGNVRIPFYKKTLSPFINFI